MDYKPSRPTLQGNSSRHEHLRPINYQLVLIMADPDTNCLLVISHYITSLILVLGWLTVPLPDGVACPAQQRPKGLATTQLRNFHVVQSLCHLGSAPASSALACWLSAESPPLTAGSTGVPLVAATLDGSATPVRPDWSAITGLPIDPSLVPSTPTLASLGSLGWLNRRGHWMSQSSGLGRALSHSGAFPLFPL